MGYQPPLSADVTTPQGSTVSTLVGTTNVESIIRASTLNQMAAPSTSLGLNSQKIINLANGSASSDGAAFGQIPVISAAVVTLIGQLNGATTRSASASAVAGEQTVLTGTTASQTLTMPSSSTQVSTPNLVMNNSTQVWTIAAGSGTTMNRNGATGSFNLVPGTFIELILIGTVWYMIRYSLAPPQVFSANGTWVPSGTGDAIFDAFVVGGGAGGGAGSTTFGGGGGGAGEVLFDFYLGNVTANQTVTVAASVAAATAGNTTSIGSLVTAKGGGAGFSGAISGIGGSGGDGSPVTTSGTGTSGNGGGGGASTSGTGSRGGAGSSRYGGGGGGGGGPTSGPGGAGGTSAGGTGGTGTTTGGGGGGGGGGSNGTNGSSGVGGAGGAGGANTGGGGGGGGSGTTPGAGAGGASGYTIIYQRA
jgi:hypothetical protein